MSYNKFTEKRDINNNFKKNKVNNQLLKTDVECLKSVNKVSINNRKYIFNGDKYKPTYQYGLNIGIYKFTDIPKDHPLGFIIYPRNQNKIKILEGNLFKSKMINDIEMFYFIDNVTLEVVDNFNQISYQCLNHGYMGGFNNFIFSDKCLIRQDNPETNQSTTIEPTSIETTTIEVQNVSENINKVMQSPEEKDDTQEKDDTKQISDSEEKDDTKQISDSEETVKSSEESVTASDDNDNVFVRKVKSLPPKPHRKEESSYINEFDTESENDTQISKKPTVDSDHASAFLTPSSAPKNIGTESTPYMSANDKNIVPSEISDDSSSDVTSLSSGIDSFDIDDNSKDGPVNYFLHKLSPLSHRPIDTRLEMPKNLFVGGGNKQINKLIRKIKKFNQNETKIIRNLTN